VTELEPGHPPADAHHPFARLDGADPGHLPNEAQVPLAGAGTHTSDRERGHHGADAHSLRAPLDAAHRGQPLIGDHQPDAPVGGQSFDGDHAGVDAHTQPVAVGEQGTSAGVGHQVVDAQSADADPADAHLLELADQLDDIERARVAADNRLLSLTTSKEVKPTDIVAVKAQEVVDGLLAIEASLIKALEQAMKAHPLGPWMERTKGVGPKQAARLLAAVGDPLWNEAEGRPRRGVAELWQFCGHGDPARSKRRKGVKVEHSPQAKMRTYLVAVSCMKVMNSPYRQVYERGRVKYAESVHAEPCVRCGPQGQPAPAGSPLSAGHQHARALRLVGKAVLKDLFVEARALDHTSREAHTPTVGGP
jgi:hypothetical protein